MMQLTPMIAKNPKELDEFDPHMSIKEQAAKIIQESKKVKQRENAVLHVGEDAPKERDALRACNSNMFNSGKSASTVWPTLHDSFRVPISNRFEGLSSQEIEHPADEGEAMQGTTGHEPAVDDTKVTKRQRNRYRVKARKAAFQENKPLRKLVTSEGGNSRSVGQDEMFEYEKLEILDNEPHSQIQPLTHAPHYERSAEPKPPNRRST